MKNKNFGKLFLAALAVLALTSCDEIKAKPSNYDDAIVDISKEQANNMESLVFKQLHDSSTYGSDVATLVFRRLFESKYGTYDEITEAVTSGSNTKIDALINKFSVYQSLNSAGNHQVDVERANVIRVYNTFQEKIAEQLWTKLSSSSYLVDNLFNEKLFAKDIYSELYSVNDISITDPFSTAAFDGLDFYGNPDGLLLTANLKLYDKDTNEWVNQEIIHIDYYKDYIERKLVPSIEQTILTQDYLYNQQYSSFGRKYARKIEYIAVPENTNFPGKARLLCLAFVNNLLDSDPTNDDFEILADAYRGIDIGDGYWTKAVELLENAGFDKVEVSSDDVEALSTQKDKDDFGSTTYYKGTVYGDNMIDFLKIKSDLKLTDSSIESSYSGSGAYSFYHGYVLKTRNNKLEDYTTKDWGIKSSGFSSLPDDISTRLFNINTSIDFEDPSDSNYLTELADGNKYLLPKTYEQGDSTPYLWTVSSKYYLVRVKEAASTTKLSKNETTEGSYINMKQDNGIYNDDVAYRIASMMSTDTAVKNNALEYVLDNSDILYHDQAIYDYFYSTYPDIFEDD